MRGKGAMRLTRSRCRRLGENCPPFVIPAQAGIQRGGWEVWRTPLQRSRELDGDLVRRIC